KRIRMTAAVLLAVNLLQALSLKPGSDFIVGDDDGARPFGNGDGVAEMIAVPVRNEDGIRGYLVSRQRRRGVAGEEGVDQDVLAIAFQQQASVTQPAHARGHGRNLRGSRALGELLPVNQPRTARSLKRNRGIVQQNSPVEPAAFVVPPQAVRVRTA